MGFPCVGVRVGVLVRMGWKCDEKTVLRWLRVSRRLGCQTDAYRAPCAVVGILLATPLNRGTAALRWEIKGVVRNSVLNFGFVTLYAVFNVSPNQIFRWYYGKEPAVNKASKMNLLPSENSFSGGAIVVNATLVPK